MIRVALETAQHEHVVNGMISPFEELPDVIGWGDRVFSLRLQPSEKDEDEPIVTYTEVFAVALVNVLES